MHRSFRSPIVPNLRSLCQHALQALALCAVLMAASAVPTARAADPLAFLEPPQAAVVQTPQVRAELVAYAPQGVAPGRTVWLGLQMTHQPLWHTYWQNPGDSGLATTLQWQLPAGVTASEIAWPAPQKIPVGTLANFGYEGTVLLPVQLSVGKAFVAPADGTLPIQLHASWLVCKEECVPQEGRFALQLPLTGSTALHAAAFQAAWDAAPTELQGPSSASFEGNTLVLRVRGLPAEWRGKSLLAVPQTPEIVESAAVPQAQDPVAADSPLQPRGQSWSSDADIGADAVWTARIPLSGFRSTTPQTLPWVLVHGAQSVRTVAQVEGPWPALPPVPNPAQAQAAIALPAAATTPATTPTTWYLALLGALVGGLLLNLMPCVFPVLAIKVLAFANTSHTSGHAHRAQGLAYTAGVVASFVLLGALMVGLRAAGEPLGWGFQLQSPAMLAGLAVLFLLLGLNLMGVFHIGQVLPARLANLQLRHPVADAFASGVLAVAIASPCTAPWMGASLGYALALPAAQALGIFAALGVGMALPYAAAGFFPGIARRLPRPGPWMDTLRRCLAFPMWATVLWLLWVLGHISGVDGAASLAAILLGVAFVAWAAQYQGRTQAVLLAVSGGTLAALVWALGANVLDDTVATSGPESMPATSATATANPWQPWSPQAVQAALAQGRPVFVDFTAAWCITCQVNKQTTLSDARVLADFATKNVQLLRADWTRKDPAITRALASLGRSGVPVYVLYQPGQAPVLMSEVLRASTLREALSRL